MMKPPENKSPAPKTAAQASTPAPKTNHFELNSKNTHRLLMGGLVTMAACFVAVLFFGLSVLSNKSDALVNLKVQVQAGDDQLKNLEQSKKDVQKYAYFKQIASTVIPNDKDQAEAVSEIFKFAQQAGIRISSITFPTSNLGLSSSTVSGAKDATTPGANAVTQAKPVSGINGLYSVELTITPQTGNDVPANLQVTYPKILAFLKSIEDNRRTAQITSVVIQPPTGTQSISFTLSTNIFIKP
ncbi:hypothetical protein KW792_01190 [Candidatus Saccharibacteria bacterium]|nr:hypothetical protein [Candidatus Saccharibacteria bacterium]